MIQWLVFKAFVKKAWVWFKHYWYLPIMLIVAVVAWLSSRRNTADILKMFAVSKESYEKEIKVLRETHEEEIRKREELITTYNATLKKLEEDYKIRLGELSTAEKREIKKIVDKHRDDPDGLAKRVGEVFGIAHVE
jgi:hypothetical protein